MRQTRIYEFWVGLFLLLGMAALVFLGLKVANIQGFSETKSYKIHATFDNIGGLKVRAPLKSRWCCHWTRGRYYSGCKSYLPIVTVAIDERYNEIPETSSLSIKTSGLLGEQYIALSIGFDDGEVAMWKEGDKVVDTKSALVLEDLVGQFLYGDRNKNDRQEEGEPKRSSV